MERLQKIIAECGIASRRKAEELIKEGKVKVNGIVVTELGTKANYEDSIVVNNKKLSFEPKVYYLLNKPKNVICSTEDPEGRAVITEYIPTNLKIFPVGRLDYDTTGAIILTNDGELANKLMHPSNKVEKTYLAKLNRVFTMEDFFKLKKGIKVEDYFVKPIKVKIKSTDEKKNISFVQLTVIQGKNHMVKNIFSELGYEVVKLSRIRYAFLSVDDLESGAYRELSSEEIKALKNC